MGIKRKKKVMTITKANVLRGWRSLEEKPQTDCVLLLVLKDTIENKVFVAVDSIENLECYECNKKYIILAWQYLPEWKEEESEQTEQKKGKWLMNSGMGTRCSNCFYKLETTGLLSYCPHCGAKMEGIL